MESSFDKSQNVNLYLRIRPPGSEYTFIQRINSEKTLVEVLKDYELKKFDFDAIFTPNDSQLKVFLTACTPVLKKVLAGFNGSIIAYGQTGTGKTFSVLGDASQNVQGFLQYSLAFLLSAQKKIGVELRAVQIHMENIYDLISGSKEKLSVSMNHSAGLNIKNLTKVDLKSVKCIEQSIASVLKNRKSQRTKLNDSSSRSHAIFEIKVSSEEFAEPCFLFFVDLAGSEKIKKSSCYEPKLFEETISINSSLMALSNCVNSMCRADKSFLSNSFNSSLKTDLSMRTITSKEDSSKDLSFSKTIKAKKVYDIHYRDSKLTMVLQKALNFKSYLSLLVTISPDELDIEESFASMKFGVTASKISLKPEGSRKTPIKLPSQKETPSIKPDQPRGKILQEEESGENYLTNFTFKSPGKSSDIRSETEINVKDTHNEARSFSDKNIIASDRVDFKKKKDRSSDLVIHDFEPREPLDTGKGDFLKIQLKDIPVFINKIEHFVLDKQAQPFVDPLIASNFSRLKEESHFSKAKIQTENSIVTSLKTLIGFMNPNEYERAVRRLICARRLYKAIRSFYTRKKYRKPTGHIQLMKLGMGKNILVRTFNQLTSTVNKLKNCVKN